MTTFTTRVIVVGSILLKRLALRLREPETGGDGGIWRRDGGILLVILRQMKPAARNGRVRARDMRAVERLGLIARDTGLVTLNGENNVGKEASKCNERKERCRGRGRAGWYAAIVQSSLGGYRYIKLRLLYDSFIQRR